MAEPKKKKIISAETGKEVKAGSLLFTNMRGEVAVPRRLAFQSDPNGDAEFTAPANFDDEGIEVSYETILPTFENPNIGHLGSSYNTNLGGLRFISRFTRVVENDVEYVVLGGEKYELVDYGVIMAAGPGLATTPDVSTEDVMVMGSSNRYVQQRSAKQEHKLYDKCNAYIDLAVTVINMDKVAGYAELEIYSRTYITVKVNGAEKHLYGDILSSTYNEVVG